MSAKAKAKGEKLSPIPRPRKAKAPATPNVAAESDGAVAAPDLSHIAEQLRPLAVPIGDLQFDPANARKHPDANLEAIKGSLAAYGQRRPAVANRRTGHVEAGNGMLQAALLLNWTHLAVIYVDDDPATAAGFAIADNRTAELADWDKDALKRLLEDVNTKNDERLDQMMADLAREEKLYPAADPEPAPVTPTEPEATGQLKCPSCGHEFTAALRPAKE